MRYGSISNSKFVFFKFYQLCFFRNLLSTQGDRIRLLNVFNHKLNHPDFAIKHL